MARRWNKERIVAAIREWHEQGKSLTHVWAEDSGLVFAAHHYFGSWRNAVLAAGYQPSQRKWSKASVVAAIRERRLQGLSVRNLSQRAPALIRRGLPALWKLEKRRACRRHYRKTQVIFEPGGCH